MKLPAGSSKNHSETNVVALTITTPTFFKVVVLIIGTILLLAALQRASHALILISTALFLALALNAPVQWLASRMPGRLRGSRTFATAISFFLIVAILVTFLVSLVPLIIRQTQSFISTVPSLVDTVRDRNSDIGGLIYRYNLENQVDNLSRELSSRLDNVGSQAFTTLSSLGSSAISILTVLVLTFMMLIEGPRWVRLIRSLIPSRRQAVADRLAANMYRVIKGFVNGQVTLAVIAAVMLLPVLLVMGVSYPFALIFVVFICGLIPMVGHSIGAIIVTIVALFTSITAGAVVLVYYFLYQQIENYVVQPRIQANLTDMSPLLVFSAVVVGVSFNGLLGGLVAIPMAGCIRIAVLEYLSRRGFAHDEVVKDEVEKVTDGATK